MPIRFRGSAGSFPESAFFPDLPRLDDIIAAIPSLRGAWDATDYSGSGPWQPRIAPASGAFCINPALSGTRPVLAERDGQPVLRMVPGGKAWVQMSDTSPMPNLTGITYASRAFFSNVVTNFQKILDFGTPEFLFRSSTTNKIWQFAGLGTGGTYPIAEPIIGWHNFTFQKSGISAAMFSADGAPFAAIGSADTEMNHPLQLGDANSSTSAEQDISRIVICDSGALTAAQTAAVQAWVTG